MDIFTHPYTLQNGATITLQAWRGGIFSACYADFRNLLQTFRLQAGQPDAEQAQQLLLDRVLSASIAAESDREKVAVADLPELFEVIAALNRLEDVAVKPLSLWQRLLQAEMSVLEAQTPESASLSLE